MTNTEVLHFIIKELQDSSLIWRGDKELFELIFSPIKYGNEIEIRRRKAKQSILDIFKHITKFDKEKFSKLLNHMTFEKNKDRYREETVTFIQEEITRLEIITDANIAELIAVISCKDSKLC